MIEAILRRVERWPREDQDELAEVAREIEARRTGMHVLSDDEERTINEALDRGTASDDVVAVFWKRHGIG